MTRRPARCTLVLLVATLSACAGADGSPPGPTEDPSFDPGDALYRAGDHDSARVVWLAQLDNPAVAGTRSEGRIRTGIGLAHWRVGAYPLARRWLEESREFKHRQGFGDDLPDSYNGLGLLARDEGRLPEAIALFDSAMVGFRRAERADRMAAVANNLGLVSFDLGRFPSARESLAEARDLARQLGDSRLLGRILANLAMVEIWSGEPPRALDVLREARTHVAAADDPIGLASALGQAGVAYRVLGRPGEALAALDSAIQVAETMNWQADIAENLVVMAGIYADAGDAQQALTYYDRAGRAYREMGLPIETGNVLRDEAMLRATRGDTDSARVNLQRALMLHREAGARREEFHDLVVLAEVERRLGEPAAAGTVALARQLAAELLSAQASVAVALVEARLANDAGRAQDALRAIEEVRAIIPRGGPSAEADAGAVELTAWLALDQVDSAVAAGRRALTAMELVRDGFASGAMRTSYLADRGIIYGDIVLALLRAGQEAEAFRVSDAARGRGIIEHLSAARGAVQRGVGVADLAEADRLSRQISQILRRLQAEEAVPPQERGPAHLAVTSELHATLAGLQAGFRDLLIRLAEREPGPSRLLGILPAGLEEVQAALPADGVLVEYHVMPSALVTFVLTRKHVNVITQPVAELDLANRVLLATELLSSLGGWDLGNPVAGALHDILVAPVARTGLLAGAGVLYIVPHGSLAYLPFAALRDPGTGQWLGETLTVISLATAAALTVERAAIASTGSGRPRAFAPFPAALPASEREVRAVRQVLPRTRMILGRGATEARLRQALVERQPALVHVASHAVMNAENPLFSRVELAPGRGHAGDDGRLEVHEVLELGITSPLVFLSGCQTARGGKWSTSWNPGEDYTTLAQSFLYAGSREVVATLWRIDDEGAAVFGEAFFRHLRSSSAGEALRRAQAELRRQDRWRHPYYWAAYTLTVAGRPTPAQTDPVVSVQ